MKTKVMHDGEWIQTQKFTHHECCDCGLVHKIKYYLDPNKVIWEKWIIDEKATKEARKKYPLKRFTSNT